jgi:hypothetical protein
LKPEVLSLLTTTSSSLSSLSFPTRRVIPIRHNFELLHLVLKYLYTKTFCFTTSTDVDKSADVPTTDDAEGIYEIANYLKIEPLETKALHFLCATCNVDNISARTFSKFAATHPNVRNKYDTYFLEHWNKVMYSDTFERVFTETEDSAESNRINTKFRELMRKRNEL